MWVDSLIATYSQCDTVDETDDCAFPMFRFKEQGENNKEALLQPDKAIVANNLRE